jgi:hypothetical protein
MLQDGISSWSTSWFSQAGKMHQKQMEQGQGRQGFHQLIRQKH